VWIPEIDRNQKGYDLAAGKEARNRSDGEKEFRTEDLNWGKRRFVSGGKEKLWIQKAKFREPVTSG